MGASLIEAQLMGVSLMDSPLLRTPYALMYTPQAGAPMREVRMIELTLGGSLPVFQGSLMTSLLVSQLPVGPQLVVLHMIGCIHVSCGDDHYL